MLLKSYKTFLELTKPGIIFGNLFTAIAGFFLASNATAIDYSILVKSIIGVSLIIACGCVINNCYDQDIDCLMERTQRRPLPQKLLSTQTALFFALILLILGCICLYYVNLIALVIALVGLFFYSIIYTMLFKRKTIYGTLIGSISGATPPVIGYVAASGRLDLGALLLFLILTAWQMPHSYAIGIFRFNDYKNAKIPLLPIVKGISATKWHMLFWIILFAIFNVMLTLSGYIGYGYLVVAMLLSLIWLYIAFKGFDPSNNDISWAKKMFFFSIIAITLLSITIIIDKLIII